MKLWQDSVNKIFNTNAFFFFLLTGATWYYHAIYIVFTYFASFTGYEEDILKVISNLQVKESKFGGKIYKFGGKSLKSWTPRSLWSLFFPSLPLLTLNWYLQVGCNPSILIFSEVKFLPSIKIVPFFRSHSPPRVKLGIYSRSRPDPIFH